jgi:predicted nucleic acid-binding protein
MRILLDTNVLCRLAERGHPQHAVAEASVTKLRGLVRQHDVMGKSAHDARLVAAMRRHDLQHLLTFNVTDFQRYGGIELLDARMVATP